MKITIQLPEKVMGQRIQSAVLVVNVIQLLKSYNNKK